MTLPKLRPQWNRPSPSQTCPVFTLMSVEKKRHSLKPNPALRVCEREDESLCTVWFSVLPHTQSHSDDSRSSSVPQSNSSCEVAKPTDCLIERAFHAEPFKIHHGFIAHSYDSFTPVPSKLGPD
ncbi:hypothetical protein MHYP_G00114620 [Metynnis hypsauchen]